MKFFKRLAILFLVFSNQSSAQFTNRIWCFGDSAGIDWTDPQNPLVFESSVLNRGGSVSIQDQVSGAFVYANGTAPNPGPNVKVYNKYHSLVQNGYGLAGIGWYHELLMLPFPGNDSILFLFGAGVTVSGPYGLYYSIINYKANNDSGIVIQKNIQLLPDPAVDALAAVRHGNGRDWWLIFQRWDNVNNSANNDYYVFGINHTGVFQLPVQNLGALHSTNGGCLRFNNEGTKFAKVNIKGLFEIYEFDRCSGLIFNPNTVIPENPGPIYPSGRYSCEFSQDGSKLYISHLFRTTNSYSYIEQYDLYSPNIAASKIVIDSFYNDVVNLLDIKKAADKKIYISTMYTGPGSFFPYPDTLYNQYNNNLSVITQPDSLGAACNFQPFSFNLGSGKSYYGLPNNPDYELGPLIGSPCDTLTGITEISEAVNFHSWFHSDWEILFVNADKLKCSNCVINVYDLSGRLIKTQKGKPYSGYFTADVALPGLSSGVYIVQLVTEKERVSGKFFKN